MPEDCILIIDLDFKGWLVFCPKTSVAKPSTVSTGNVFQLFQSKHLTCNMCMQVIEYSIFV